MLTKDLLTPRAVKERIYPGKLKEDHMSQIEKLVQVAQDACGQSRDLFEQALLGARGGLDQKVHKGLVKLILDRCEEDEPDPKLPEERLQWMVGAQELRRDAHDVEDYERSVAHFFAESIETIRSRLYEDLPHRRKVLKVLVADADQLRHRYQAGQIQGVLLFCENLELDVTGMDQGSKRALLRGLRFHRLLSAWDSPNTLILSGPLGIFQKAQTYGIRLANFFPYLLHLAPWQMEARIKWKGQHKILRVDHKCGIKSWYRRPSDFVPPEFAAFAEAFAKVSKRWKIHPGGQVSAGHGEIPRRVSDFTFSHPELGQRHLELFHRWHGSDLVAMGQKDSRTLPQEWFYGICKSLQNKAEIKNLLEKNNYLRDRVFWFSDFPTPKVVLAQLANLGA